jgi:multisubunit Na+/H+ antiporter MnhB subunit
MCARDDNFGSWILVMLMMLLVGSIVGTKLGEEFPSPYAVNKAKTELRIEAVKAGLAEWIVVDDTGKTEIRFKSIQAEKLLSPSAEDKK